MQCYEILGTRAIDILVAATPPEAIVDSHIFENIFAVGVKCGCYDIKMATITCCCNQFEFSKGKIGVLSLDDIARIHLRILVDL